MLNVGLSITNPTSTGPSILQPEYRPPPCSVNEHHVQLKEYETLFNIRMFIACWSRDFGPTDSWPHTLLLLREKVAESCKGVEWRRELKDKVQQGLRRLSILKNLILELSIETEWVIRYIWSQAFDLAVELQKGIACLQVHLAMYEV